MLKKHLYYLLSRFSTCPLAYKSSPSNRNLCGDSDHNNSNRSFPNKSHLALPILNLIHLHLKNISSKNHQSSHLHKSFSIILSLLPSLHSTFTNISHRHWIIILKSSSNYLNDENTNENISPLRSTLLLHTRIQRIAIRHTPPQCPLSQDSFLVQYLLVALSLASHPVNHSIHNLLNRYPTLINQFDPKVSLRLWSQLLNTQRPSPTLLVWFITTHCLNPSSSPQHLPYPPPSPPYSSTFSRLLAASIGHLIPLLPPHSLLRFLDSWQSFAPQSATVSTELLQRRLQLIHRLQNRLSLPLPPNNDPYLTATYLRLSPQPIALLRSLPLSRLRVLARAKGLLIPPSHPSDPKAPGPVLALAQALAAMPNPNPAHLDRLLSLRIDPPQTIEHHRLARRQSHALATHVFECLTRSHPPYALLLDRLERTAPHLIRPTVWASLFRSHLLTQTLWSSPGGLCRLLRLVESWRNAPSTQGVYLAKIWPKDTPLAVIDRTLFPSDQPDHQLDDNLEASTAVEERIAIILSVVHAFGGHRRLEGRRACRLVFLALRNHGVEWGALRWKAFEKAVLDFSPHITPNVNPKKEIQNRDLTLEFQKGLARDIDKGIERYKEQSLVYALAKLVSDRVAVWLGAGRDHDKQHKINTGLVVPSHDGLENRKL